VTASRKSSRPTASRREPSRAATVAVRGTFRSSAISPKESGLWLHVDAAYGGFAALTERGRAALRGIELADSITLDPHKWLYQPYEAGCVLVRDRRKLLHSFRIVPDYLRDAEVSGDRKVNFGDLGIQLTRSSRALKVWVSLQYFGVGAFRRAIDRCLDLAVLAQAEVERAPELELLSPASLSVLCFRRRPAGVHDEAELAELNAELVRRVAVSGEGCSPRRGSKAATRSGSASSATRRARPTSGGCCASSSASR
jgi:aromatic-L-amino-acid/L-tryptophan decarboxylase